MIIENLVDQDGNKLPPFDTKNMTIMQRIVRAHPTGKVFQVEHIMVWSKTPGITDNEEVFSQHMTIHDCRLFEEALCRARTDGVSTLFDWS